MMTCVHIVAEGLVQGVGFRWFVARHADQLGIRGFVRNLYNGSVEVTAIAERSLLEDLIRQVKVGPRSAQVTNVIIHWDTDAGVGASDTFTHFEIR
jgi:acylphosphatase